MFRPLPLSIALRFALSRKAHKFAFFVALLSALGIALGVCALITVSAVMQGLQNRLKDSVLDTTAHVVVQVKDEKTLPFLLSQPEVKAVLPYLQGEVLLQTEDDLSLAILQGYNPDSLIPAPGTAPQHPATADRSNSKVAARSLQLLPTPPAGSYSLILPSSFMLEHGLEIGSKVRLISTINARYTPLGLTPTQRVFSVAGNAQLPLPGNHSPTLLTALDDARRLLRESGQYYRLFLSDPFLIEDLADKLTAAGLTFSDWRASQGDFFRAVALEKLSMSVMLCLIILTASFNILSALTMLVSARGREIAVLKTLGADNSFILKVFMLQGLFCATAGIVLGIVTGLPLAFNAQQVLEFLGITIMRGTLPIVVSVQHIALIAGGCLALAALCTLYPARKAAACDPALHLSTL